MDQIASRSSVRSGCLVNNVHVSAGVAEGSGARDGNASKGTARTSARWGGIRRVSCENCLYDASEAECVVKEPCGKAAIATLPAVPLTVGGEKSAIAVGTRRPSALLGTRYQSYSAGDLIWISLSSLSALVNGSRDQGRTIEPGS
jgi:hypothetical protein